MKSNFSKSHKFFLEFATYLDSRKGFKLFLIREDQKIRGAGLRWLGYAFFFSINPLKS